ncbi:MAG: hypothetical protein M0R17_03215 [Candidatus Omnitrophica bacterium]|jgi:hypothetical protein|nr:hypothetical protein [Candidatus Omnitrophota bacterium]
MNLRKDLNSPIENLIELFKKRTSYCKKKKEIENDITFQNEQLEKQLIEIFTPICQKHNTNIYIIIEDNATIFTTNLNYRGHTYCLGNINLNLNLQNINHILFTKESLCICIRKVEQHLRYFNIFIKNKNIQKNKYKQCVTVTFDTRNRYF